VSKKSAEKYGADDKRGVNPHANPLLFKTGFTLDK
jgi:hypothetical protein